MGDELGGEVGGVALAGAEAVVGVGDLLELDGRAGVVKGALECEGLGDAVAAADYEEFGALVAVDGGVG